MGTILHSESRRLYSWWWDSHISPKNSKWLQENLTDMDAKVKAMIKLIEEDADSFARRAEMYYKKRPELMKLVEEFYRAYRALAERYDHATVELRQAHRTMVQAFPDQLPFILGDDTLSSSEPDTPETPHLIHALSDSDHSRGMFVSASEGTKRRDAFTTEPKKGFRRQGLKQLSDMFQSSEGAAQESRFADGNPKVSQGLNEGKLRETNLEGDSSELSKDNQKLKDQIRKESEHASKAELELQTLREALSKLEAERDVIFLLHQQILDKLSAMEKDLSHAQICCRGFDDQACGAKAELEALKEISRKLESEKDASLLQYRQALNKLAAAEGLVSEAQEDAKGFSEQAPKAESQNLKQDLANLEAEKVSAQLLYKQCLETIAALERKLALAEKNLRVITERSAQAEGEVNTLKEEIRKLSEERDAVSLLYEQCLATISKLQKELSEAWADNERLNSDILLGSAKLKGAEEQCLLLGKMNEALQLEAQNLTQKIAAADQEFSRKQSELDKLLISLQDEHSRFVQAEANLNTLQNLHSQSQEEQKALALELKNGLRMMKDMEICKHDLEVEIQRLKSENQTLNDMYSSSSLSQKNLQDEILRLKKMKEKLEADVKRQAEQSDVLQLQVQNEKEEIKGLYRRYQALMQQVECVGLDPESFGSTIKGLQHENSMLKEISMKDKADRELLTAKLQGMEELVKKNSILEISLSDVSTELQKSKETAKAFQKSCSGLHEEKSSLVSEKSALLSQLQIITETMRDLLEKNTSLQTSLCDANAELEGLREKTKGFEDICQLLRTERSHLLAERSSLLSRLEVVEQKLGKLEMRFTNLDDKYAGLEKEKQTTLSQVEELRIALDVEKRERACLVLKSDVRLSGLEGHIHDLQEKTKYMKEFEEQLEKAVNAQLEIFIMQKFIQDVEDKNSSLLVECQRHVEAAKFSEKVITELENENMIQQVEAEILVDKIEMLREGINQVVKVLEIKHGSEAEPDRNFLPCALANIRFIKSSLSESKDENQQLLIENSVLSTICGQLHLERAEISSKKAALVQELLLLTEHLLMLEDERQHLLERSRQLNMEVEQREKTEEALQTELEHVHVKQVQLQGSYAALEEENRKALEQNRSVLEELHRVKEEKYNFEEENSAILVDALAFCYQAVIFESFGVDKVTDLDRMSKDTDFLGKAYMDLEKEGMRLEQKLLMMEIENLALRESMKKLEEIHLDLHACSDQLRGQISDTKQLLIQRETKLSEVEEKLKVEEDMKMELCTTVQFLEQENADLKVSRVVLEKQIVELSEHNRFQDQEVCYLREANGSLESEVGHLHEELEECKIREVIFASELQERSSEFELWEAEAASFYFDLQTSAVCGALFEKKVDELGSLCDCLEDVSNRRSVELERMKVRVSFLESEAEALKSQLTTCLPLISSLKDDIALLEQNPVLQGKLQSTSGAQREDMSGQVEEISSSPDTLLELQTRIKIIEDVLERELVAMPEQANASIRLEPSLRETKNLKLRPTEVRVGAELKDIPLDQASGKSLQGTSQRGSATSDDQMLELWEAAEQDCSHNQLINDLKEQGAVSMEDDNIVYARLGDIDQTSLYPTPETYFEKELGIDTLGMSRQVTESNRKENKKGDLERLASDAQKLTNIQISLQELRRKIEPNKRRKKAEDAECDGFRRQLQNMENSVVHLMDMNTELMRTIEESGREERESEEAEGVQVQQERVLEQARKEAEKIGRLELEMQQVQYALLRLIDDNKSKDKGARSNAAILLRDFFYSRGRKSKKSKKSCFCGCLRPTAART